MNEADRDLLELERLTHALEEGLITDEEKSKLEEMLRLSESLREEYFRLTELSVSIGRWATEAVAPRMRPGWRSPAGLAFAAAAVLVLGGLIMFFPRDFTAAAEVAEARESGCAVLTRTVDVKWTGASFEAGFPVSAGAMAIADGLMELEFYSGARVVIEGPAVVELVSPAEIRCKEGKLRAMVPPSTRGFRVSSDQFMVTNEGAEFGLRAGHNGRDEVHVFEGRARIQSSSGLNEVSAGRALASNGVVAFDGTLFVGADELGEHDGKSSAERYDAWLAFRSEVRRDSRLAVYFSFDGADASSRTLMNMGSPASDQIEGAVVGARRAEGRMPGKSALSFKSSGDRVRMDVPGEYPAITLACWVKVDALDRAYNSLFLTDGFSAGNPHWQIDRAGRLILGVKKQGMAGQDVFYSPPILGPSKAGRWVHLASTFDTGTGVGAHYLNGTRIHGHGSGGATSAPIRIGPSELGNWGLPNSSDPQPIRNLNGAIDEFMLFTEALSPDEIRYLFTSRPRPSL